MEKVRWLCDISCAIAKEARCVEVDEGIGDYEYWGAKYRDRQMVWRVEAGSCEIDVTDCVTDEEDETHERSAIPVVVEATANGHGADVDLEATLESVRWNKEHTRCFATYSWDGE